MAKLLDQFEVDVPNSGSRLAVKLYASRPPRQLQLALRPQDGRLQLDRPMLFWADCTLVAHQNNNDVVAVGWAQTMTTTLVEFCYSTPTHGCVAELDLIPNPCADGGQGIWYGGTNTAALQFLGSAYADHDRDEVYFNLINNSVLEDGGTEFQQQAQSKRTILSDSPFIMLPEQANCRTSSQHLPVALAGSPFSMGRGSPVRTTDNSQLLANAQLECVKARYRFKTYFCALTTNNAAAVPGLTQAYAFAEILWGADYTANLTGIAIRRQWAMSGPIKIRDAGVQVTQYTRKDGQQHTRCPGVPCNQGNRGVEFDYRQLALFY